jgi:nitrilase
MSEWTLAAVQAEPEILDSEGCLEKAVGIVERSDEADLIAFPETFVPGYAQWAHDAAFEDEDHKAAYARLAANTLQVPEDLAPIQEAAREAHATVVFPVTETVPQTPGTLYNTMTVIGPEGTYLGKHRKLVPTHHERTVYGYGDGDTMRAFEAEGTRFGGLLCWENYMPLARAALYEQGIEVYVAPTADDLESWQTTMKHVARESRCFVVAPALLQRKASFPDDFELAHRPTWEREPAFNERGGSVIVGPDGEVLAGPIYEKEAVVTATVDLADVVAERQTFDPAGHFGRSEVLDLTVRGLEDPL